MLKDIKRDEYLTDAQQLSPNEKRLIQEINTWLPDSFIDVHAHCNLKENVPEIDQQGFRHMLSTFPWFNLKESQQINELLHPGKSIRTLRFPQVFRGVNHKDANEYLLQFSPMQDRVALFGLHNDIDYTISMLENHPRVTALKMYHTFPNPPATQIYEFFPPEILDVAQSWGIPIILHPPKPIELCFNQILRLMKDFPQLKVCLAHVGLTAKYNENFKTAMHKLSSFDTIFFDTSMISDPTVIQTAITITNGKKVMYGSDAPLHLIRATEYLHPQKGMRLAASHEYHWVDPIDHKEYGHLAINSPHIHWHAIGAVKQAILSFPQKEQARIQQDVFIRNAEQFYGF